MKMKKRVMAKTILRAVKTFPALLLTGPRQSGKTTLLRMLFSKTHTFINLEDPDVRQCVIEAIPRFSTSHTIKIGYIH